MLVTCGNCGEKVSPTMLDEHAAYQCVRIAMEKAKAREVSPKRKNAKK